MGLRILAILPAAFSAVAFILSIILAVAGTKPGMASDFFILSLNMSKVGSNVVKFSAANMTQSGGVLSGIMGVPGLGDLIGNATNSINGGLTNLEADIVTNVTRSIGMKDEYVMYFQNICEGMLVNPSDPSKGMMVKECPKWGDVAGGLSKLTDNLPTYLVVGTENVSVPALASLSKGLGDIKGTVDSATTAIITFVFIGLVSSGVVMLLSLPAILMSRSRFVVVVNVWFSLIAPTALIFAAIIATILATVVVRVVNDFGDTIGISATTGTRVLATTWLAWIFSLFSGTYWFTVWLAEFRKTTLVRRWRPEENRTYSATASELRAMTKIENKEK